MNRIQHLREKRRLTQAELAAKVGTTQETISRWENGERFPRGRNLKMLAEALGVEPADLINAVLAIDLQDEFVPVEVILSSALTKLGIKAYKVTSDSVSRAGIYQGDLVLLNCTPEALKSLKPGDFVAVEAENENGDVVRVLRQYLPPDLITTNRDGTNLSIRISDGPHSLRIIAKVIPQ